ncbi:MAG: glutamate--tRNA ligase [Erysipelotrichaceae bacterium]|nr:glutamate--tRNA ligase [Erysipelotrichaceae bacterium]
MKKIRTRFAPSPTGYMHIGNLRTALYEYLVAKKDDGTFILRIEDTDQGRLVEGATDIIYETLKQCKMFHDEGPDVGGNYGPYIQSDRMKSGIYKEYANKLVDLNGAHYCFCSEEDIENQRKIALAKGESFIYKDPCKNISVDDARERIKNGESFVVRQNIPSFGTTTFHDEVYGDVTVENSTLDEAILLKSDGFPTYNFANIIDDHMMEITHVIRGNEYLSSTPKYNLIYESFGWEIPTYVHCPPVMKDEHSKLSKRNGDASFQDLVKKGYLPEAIINYIALLGWAPETEQEIYSLDELKKAFNVKRINTSGAIFDIEKLTWMNGMYLRNMNEEKYFETVKSYIKQAVSDKYNHLLISKIVQQRANTLAEIPEMLSFFDNYPEFNIEFYTNKKMKTDPEISLNSLKEAYDVLSSIECWNEQIIHDALMNKVQELSIKNGQLLFPLRVAITNMQFTPGGAIEISNILGKEETLKRIKQSIENLEK